MIEEEYPSGRVVKNSYDTNGDIARIHGTSNSNATERTYANSFKFLPDGRIERLRVGNGLWEKAKFNDRLQVTEFGLGRGAENMNLWKLNLEYGELQANGTVDKSKNTGNLAKQTISFDGLPQPFEQTYKYDSLYRITEAKETNNGNQTWVQNFGYDRYGNRTTLSQNILGQQLAINKFTHPTIDPNTNRFDAGQDYSYDKVGNLVGDADNRSFTFDGNNKQILVTNLNSQSVGEYFYDGDGKRVKKKSYVGGVLDETVIFVYSGGKLVEEFSTKAPPTNPQTKYVATDHLQSIRALSNQDGEIVSRRDFMPFGEELQADSSYRKSNLKYNNDDVRQKFTGYEKDKETGLDFAQARMYQNQHGRFTAPDPLLGSGGIDNPQSFNRYAYTANNPVNYVDPDGLNWCLSSGGNIEFAGKGASCRSGWETLENGSEHFIGSGGNFNGTGPIVATGSTVRLYDSGEVQIVEEGAEVLSAEVTVEATADTTELIETDSAVIQTSITQQAIDTSLSALITIGENNGLNILDSILSREYKHHTETGRNIGDFASGLQGFAEFTAGFFGAGGGTVFTIITLPACATGVGCAIPATTATITTGSLTLMGHGSFVIGNTIYNMSSRGSSSSSGNTNPYKDPVDKDITVVDPKGNAIPIKKGEQIQGSPDGSFQQVKDKNGNPTGTRKDAGHPKHKNPKAKGPHGHRRDKDGNKVTINGDPHLPINN